MQMDAGCDVVLHFTVDGHPKGLFAFPATPAHPHSRHKISPKQGGVCGC